MKRLFLALILLGFMLPSFSYGATQEFGAYVTALGSGSAGVSAADLVVIVQGGVAKKLTIGQLIGLYILDGVDGSWGIGLKTNTTGAGMATPTGYDGIIGLVNSKPAYQIGSNGVKYFMNQAQTLTQCITIKDPTDASDYLAFRFPNAATVTATHCLITGSTSITGQFDLCGTSGTACAAVDSVDMTCTTTISDDTSLNGGSNTLPSAGQFLKWRSQSADGTPTSLIACFDYTTE